MYECGSSARYWKAGWLDLHLVYLVRLHLTRDVRRDAHVNQSGQGVAQNHRRKGNISPTLFSSVKL